MFGGLVGTAAFSAEHTGDTHRLLGIADCQVTVGELVLHTVKCDERCALWHRLYHDLMTGHHVGIEAMQGLSISHHHIVRDIHDVIDRTEADGGQLVLQPFRTLLDFTVGDTHAGITFAGLLILDHHIDGQRLVIHGECTAVRTVQGGRIAVLFQPGIQVACHSPVRECISTVRRDVHLYQPVTLQMIIFGSRCAHHGIVGKDDDPVMTGTHADLILGADHPAAFHTAQLTLLDHKLLITVIQHAA